MNRKRISARTRNTRSAVSSHQALLETLESRQLLSTYYVSPSGADGGAGTSAAPWQTLQKAANSVVAGDTVIVRAGTYSSGFVLNWDYDTGHGTATAPISFLADPGATITGRNNKTPDAIDLEPGSGGVNYVVIRGFTITNPSGSITRAGIRVEQSTGVIVRNNNIDGMGTWGIFSSFAQNILIENNVTSNSVSQHGIYVSNSADNPIVRNNLSYGNGDCGVQINSDASQGGDGVITGAQVYNNIFHDNQGSGINLDGVQSSVFKNNLIYNNHAYGIALYMDTAAAPAMNNLIVNNTIIGASDSRYAISDKNGSTGNTIFNNILLNNNAAHGSFNTDGLTLTSDYNIVGDVYSTSDGADTTDFAGWKSSTGQDAHSFIAAAAQLFVNPAANDYHLLAGSPASNAGASILNGKSAPATDLAGDARPAGGGMDIGAYESAIDTRPPQVVRVTPVSAVAGTSTCVFRVTYADDTALDFASIGTGDILVTGPHHFSQRAACISKVVFSPKLTTVTYRIKAPGGRWSVAGAGTYTITLQPGQVADMAGNRMTTQLLGTFKYGVKVKPLASNHFSSKLIIA